MSSLTAKSPYLPSGEMSITLALWYPYVSLCIMPVAMSYLAEYERVRQPG